MNLHCIFIIIHFVKMRIHNRFVINFFFFTECKLNLSNEIAVLSAFPNRMTSPPIPVPTSGYRHSTHEALSHSHPNESGNKPVLSPGTANRNPGTFMLLVNCTSDNFTVFLCF